MTITAAHHDLQPVTDVPLGHDPERNDISRRIINTLLAGTALAATIYTTGASSERPIAGCDNPTHVTVDIQPTSYNPLSAVRNSHDPLMHAHSLDGLAAQLTSDYGYMITGSEIATRNHAMTGSKPGEYCMTIPEPAIVGYRLTESGDTLASLAHMYSVTVGSLQHLNPELARTPISADLPTGTMIRVTQALDESYAEQISGGDLTTIAKREGISLADLELRNIARLASGQDVVSGDKGVYLPLQQTPYETAHHLTPSSLMTAFDHDGAYGHTLDVPLAPEVSVPKIALTTEQINLIDTLPGRTPEQRSFLKEVITTGMQLQAEGMPINVAIYTAQVIDESDWGKSGLTKVANNFAGIKPSKDTPADHIVSMITTEYYHGKKWVGPQPFRVFDTREEGLRASAKLWLKPWFAGALEHPDDIKGQTATQGLQEELATASALHLWATSPTYAKTLTSIARDNNLDAIMAAGPGIARPVA